MGIVAHSLRLVAVGNLPSGEVFNTGLWTLSDVAIPDYNALILAMATPQSAFNTFFTNIKAYWCVGTKVSELKGYYYDGGESGSTATLSASVPLTTNEGAAAIKMPDQCTMVASLRTGRAGRSFRGRMYIPTPALTISNDSQVPSVNTVDIATRTATLITTINASSLGVVVMSATQTAATPVTAVQVNSVVDTQRRRTNKIVPNQTSIVNPTAH